MFVYALAVTALAVWVTSYLGKLAALRKGKDPGEDGREKAANAAGVIVIKFMHCRPVAAARRE